MSSHEIQIVCEKNNNQDKGVKVVAILSLIHVELPEELEVAAEPLICCGQGWQSIINNVIILTRLSCDLFNIWISELILTDQEATSSSQAQFNYWDTRRSRWYWYSHKWYIAPGRMFSGCKKWLIDQLFDLVSCGQWRSYYGKALLKYWDTSRDRSWPVDYEIAPNQLRPENDRADWTGWAD